MADRDTAEQRGPAFAHAELTGARFPEVAVRGARIEAELDRRGPGGPDQAETFLVRERLGIVHNEEWWHRRYAERALAVLEDRG
jgi:hypothetical protein